MALQVITPPMTDTALRDLRRRTAARLMAARVEMRAGWPLHPDNAVQRHAMIIDYSPALEHQCVGRVTRQVMPWSMSRNDIELLENLRGECRP